MARTDQQKVSIIPREDTQRTISVTRQEDSAYSCSAPGSAEKADQKSRILQVKSMFGSAELDEDSIKYFAKNDFYPDSLAGLEEQIYTCIKAWRS
jgi:hypothetical protein